MPQYQATKAPTHSVLMSQHHTSSLTANIILPYVNHFLSLTISWSYSIFKHLSVFVNWPNCLVPCNASHWSFTVLIAYFLIGILQSINRLCVARVRDSKETNSFPLFSHTIYYIIRVYTVSIKFLHNCVLILNFIYRHCETQKGYLKATTYWTSLGSLSLSTVLLKQVSQTMQCAIKLTTKYNNKTS